MLVKLRNILGENACLKEKLESKSHNNNTNINKISNDESSNVYTTIQLNDESEVVVLVEEFESEQQQQQQEKEASSSEKTTDTLRFVCFLI